MADSGNHTVRKIKTDGTVSTLAGLARSSGSSDGTGSAARFNFPMGVSVDSNNSVFVSDSRNQTLRKITPGGVVTTLAGLLEMLAAPMRSAVLPASTIRQALRLMRAVRCTSVIPGTMRSARSRRAARSAHGRACPSTAAARMGAAALHDSTFRAISASTRSGTSMWLMPATT